MFCGKSKFEKLQFFKQSSVEQKLWMDRQSVWAGERAGGGGVLVFCILSDMGARPCTNNKMRKRYITRCF